MAGPFLDSCSASWPALVPTTTSSISVQVHALISSGGKSFFSIGTVMLSSHAPPIAAVTVTTDASGSFGCGAFSHELGWFQLKWPASWNTTHIAAKELVPIVIAAVLWGPRWHGRCIGFCTDNMAVVEVLHSRTASDPLLMHLLRCLVFYAAVHHFDFVGEHIPGKIT